MRDRFNKNLSRAAWPSQRIGRLAMREEGKCWRAYYALPGTMKDALYLGEIQLAFVQTQERKDAFMAIMREGIGDILEAVTGERPTWPDPAKPAPEHERLQAPDAQPH